MIPSLNLATDSLGLGKIFGGFSNASVGTVDCGSKPTCISFGKNSNCAKKVQAYNDCIAKTSQAKLLESQRQPQAQTQQNPTYLLIVLVIALIIFIIIKARKNA